ncbi:MAG TPA: D-alanyl-D-alanine carboxypeptidase, partial [Nannocystis sp.]
MIATTLAACEGLGAAQPADPVDPMFMRDEPALPSAPARRIPEAAPVVRSPLARRLEAFAAEVAARRAERVAPKPGGQPQDLTIAAGPPAVFDVAGLDAAIRKIVAPLERSTDISVHIRELASEDVLFDYRGDAPLNPASNHKLLTAAAALDLLGADFRFETRVVLHDSALHVIGEGDPTLDDLALRELAAEVAGAVDPGSLRKIVVDDLVFSPRTLAPGFSDEGVGEAYQAPSGALSLDFNTVEVTAVAPRVKTKPGELVPLQVTLRPQSPHVVVDNRAVVGRGAVTVRSYAGMELAGQARTVVELTGKLRAGRTLVERRRVVDPGLYTGGALAVM